MSTFLNGPIANVFYQLNGAEVFVCNLTVSSAFCRHFLVFNDNMTIVTIQEPAPFNPDDPWSFKLTDEIDNSVAKANPPPTRDTKLMIMFMGIFEDEYNGLNGKMCELRYTARPRKYYITRDLNRPDTPGHGPLALHISTSTKELFYTIQYRVEHPNSDTYQVRELDPRIVDQVKHLGRLTWTNLLSGWADGSIDTLITQVISMPLNTEYRLRTFNIRTGKPLNCKIINRKIIGLE